MSLQIFKAGIPNPRAMAQYQAMAHSELDCGSGGGASVHVLPLTRNKPPPPDGPQSQKVGESCLKGMQLYTSFESIAHLFLHFEFC